jgi:hypothetical protein
MTELLNKAQSLEADLHHLAQEMNRLAYANHPAGSTALQYARQEFRELEATYKTKVQQLASLGHSLVLASLNDQVARAAHHLDWNARRPALRPVPSAVGGARYVTEVLVLHMFLPGFYKALHEWGGVVVSERPHPGSGDSAFYTVSLDCVNELFELGSYMVMNYYQDKVGGLRHD